MLLDRIIPVGSANCRIDYSNWNKLTYQLTGPDIIFSDEFKQFTKDEEGRHHPIHPLA